MRFQRQMTRKFDKLGVRVRKDENGRNYLVTIKWANNGKGGIVPLLDRNGKEIPQDVVRIVKGKVVMA